MSLQCQRFKGVRSGSQLGFELSIQFGWNKKLGMRYIFVCVCMCMCVCA